MNERDSEIMAQSLYEQGYIEAPGIETADVIIINTCSIRAKAEQKALSMLGMLKSEKKNRPDLKICVVGCVAQQEGRQLLDRMPHLDCIIGTQNIYSIPILLDACDTGKQIVTSMAKSFEIPRFIPNLPQQGAMSAPAVAVRPFKKFVTIMQGCNNFCTYCVVPYTRGREISRNKKDIIDEVKVLVDGGIREITLLGQNVNSYGTADSIEPDGSHFSFPELLQDIAGISGLRRIRFTTSHPKDLSGELMRCFRDIDILCHQIHLPVQAGSDAVLKRMNRKYTVAEYQDKIDALRGYCAEIAITTDIIVGFPGETEDDFEQTMKLLERVRFDGSFSFKYSDRPGTKASELSEKIAEDVKSKRLGLFQKRQDEISLAKNGEFVGKKLIVMMEAVDGERSQGRSEYNHVVHIDTGSSLIPPGDLVEVHIYHAGQHSLKGRIV